MRRSLALAVVATTLGACLFPDLGGLATDAGALDVSSGSDVDVTDDASSDASNDASTRIKDITFENGLIVDPLLGASLANYPLALLKSDAGPLMGAFSVGTQASVPDAANQVSSVIQDFAPPSKLYVSMLMRVESEPSSQARFFKLGNNLTTVEGYIVPVSGSFVIRLKLRLSSSSDKILGDSSPFPLHQTVRFGVEAFQQSSASAMDAVVNGYASLGTADFPTPFATSAQETLLGPSDEVVLGASTTLFVDIAFDDIRLDSAQMPEP